MFGLGSTELIIIAVIILLLFGGAKLPQLMKGLGQGIGEFNKGLQDSKKALRESADTKAAEENAEKPADTSDKTVSKDLSSSEIKNG